MSSTRGTPREVEESRLNSHGRISFFDETFTGISNQDSERPTPVQSSGFLEHSCYCCLGCCRRRLPLPRRRSPYRLKTFAVIELFTEHCSALRLMLLLLLLPLLLFFCCFFHSLSYRDVAKYQREFSATQGEVGSFDQMLQSMLIWSRHPPSV